MDRDAAPPRGAGAADGAAHGAPGRARADHARRRRKPTTTTEREAVRVPAIQSAVRLDGIDHAELYVGNAHQAAHFYRTAFGFRPVARAGLETGVRDRISVVMEQGDIRLVLTSGLDPDSPIAEHAAPHGDGVKDVAFRVDDVESAFETAVRKGARPVAEPSVHGELVIAQPISPRGRACSG